MYNLSNFPVNTGYTPWYSQPQSQSQQQNNNSLIWVQGEEGAKAYFLSGPNQSALLMDSENNVFYIKSTDASGMPMPLRTFDYSERVVVAKNATAIPAQTPEYITRQEFEKVIEELRDAKRSVPTV